MENYTIATRNQLFAATRDQLHHLLAALRRGGVSKLNMELVVELMTAGLNAPGFSERQRWELMQAAEYHGPEIRLSPLAEWWPWEALGRKANMPEDLVEVGSFSPVQCPGQLDYQSSDICLFKFI